MTGAIIFGGKNPPLVSGIIVVVTSRNLPISIRSWFLLPARSSAGSFEPRLPKEWLDVFPHGLEEDFILTPSMRQDCICWRLADKLR